MPYFLAAPEIKRQKICPERQEELTIYLITVLQITLYLTRI